MSDNDEGGVPVRQIIDDVGEWTGNLTDAMKEWELYDAGHNYNTVAVFGCQSSGKSTLLNILFKTDFNVMDESMGRSQTTKGMWAGKAKDSSILVLDVEGTDSKERGENHSQFERKTALFSLAVAEVLIVNMWNNDIGRFEAANYGLLKTVFSLNLQLFAAHKEAKTLLLVVIRDHGRTPLERLRETILTDIETLWADIAKPEEFTNASVSDFFDFAFFALPHYEHAYEKFMDMTVDLRDNFYNTGADDYYFLDAYKKRIPADGFSMFASDVWDTIVSNKDLNLPTQREMLAMYRCDEIIEEAFTALDEVLGSVRSTLESRDLVSGMSEVLTSARSAALEIFDTATPLYHTDVVNKKREALLVRIGETMNPLLRTQLRLVGTKATEAFPDTLANELSSGEPNQFADSADAALQAAVKSFDAAVEDSLFEGADTVIVDEVREDIVKFFESEIAKERVTAVDAAMAGIHASLKKRLTRPLNKIFDTASPDMWEEVGSLVKDTHSRVDIEIIENLSGFKAPTREFERWTAALYDFVDETVKSTVRAKCENILPIMSRAFDAVFRYDADRVPRRWHKDHDVRAEYTKAREAAFAVLDMFASVPDGIEGVSGEIVDEEEIERLRELFVVQSEAAYLEAVRQQETVLTADAMPMWLIVLICGLGWNELFWLLTNPIQAILLTFVGGVAFAAHKTGLLGPTVSVLNAFLSQKVGDVQSLVEHNLAAASGEHTGPRAPHVPPTAGTPTARDLQGAVSTGNTARARRRVGTAENNEDADSASGVGVSDKKND